MRPKTLIVVAAHNEAERIAATILALAEAFPGAPVWVADDSSTDATPEIARAAGAEVLCAEPPATRRRAGRLGGRGASGKGRAMSRGAEAALAHADMPSGEAVAGDEAVVGSEAVVVLCDGDLGESARQLAVLVEAIRRGEADLAVAAFSTRAGGGLGMALAFSRWAIRRRCGLAVRAPLSGQRAMRASVLPEVLPFAHGYGMEIAMTVRAVRAGRRVLEIDLPLTHRPTGRTLAGFAHRGRQLIDFVRAYLLLR
jgi:glycosyltransferase involved in cell wall biosynthesis